MAAGVSGRVIPHALNLVEPETNQDIARVITLHLATEAAHVQECLQKQFLVTYRTVLV